MNRTEFMNQLEYLLQDIPEEEKADAIAYYQDYLEEAGDENEAEAIREFGSPERIAAMIRAELNGSLEDGGSFTDAGYQDERFKDPGYQVVKHQMLPEVREAEEERKEGWKENRKEDWKENWQERKRKWWFFGRNLKYGKGAFGGSCGRDSCEKDSCGRDSCEKDSYGRDSCERDRFGRGDYGRERYDEGEESGKYDSTYGRSRGGRKYRAAGEYGEAREMLARVIRVIILLALLSIAAPVLLGIGGSAVSIAMGILLLMIAAVMLVGILTAAAGIGAVSLFVMGLVTLFREPWDGLLLTGCGVLLFGLALLGTALSILVYGKMVPFCIRSAVDWVSRLLHGGRRMRP